MEFWSEELEEKLIELWKKHACLYTFLVTKMVAHKKIQTYKQKAV